MSINADDQGLPVPDGPTISSEEAAAEPLSKKSQKKAAKAARYAEQKVERRAREKERKKLKRAAAQPQPHDEDEGVPKSKRAKLGRGSQTKFGARLVVDLGFDDKMTEKVRARPRLPPCRSYLSSHKGSGILILTTCVRVQCK